MASEVDVLVEMGFERSRAEHAMIVTNNKGVEPAMEWLLAHADSVVPPSPAPVAAPPSVAPVADCPVDSEPSAAGSSCDPPTTQEDDSQVAKSMKCEDCGKLFTSQTDVEFHAVKSGHTNFSESTEEKKPLSEEEKKEQLAKLEEKIKQKRKEREEKEKQEQLEREKIRIRSGKEIQDAKLKAQEQEMKKIVEQRRRDKIEDQRAKDKVRQQIQADREARKLASQGIQPSESPAPAPVPTPVVVQAPSNKPTAASTRLQLRLPDGRAVTQVFNSKEQLGAVRLFLTLNDMKDTPFNLMTTFPKRVFTEEDYEKPLDILGLIPSAVIIVSKTQNQFANGPNYIM